MAINPRASRPHRRSSGARRAHIETVSELVDRLAREVDWVSALPPHAHSPGWHLAQFVKRVFDIVVSGIGLIILAPFFVIIAILIRLDSPGGALYTWTAVGYRGRRFKEYKFRTMVMDAEQVIEDVKHLNEMDGPVFKIRNDPRVTRLGRFLRRYSIDELPQIWNVFLGDMSLVGPRPLIWHEFANAEPHQRLKLAVTPGITCLWQVSGRSAITSFQEWVDLDLEYIRDWSLRVDLLILLRTIPVVLRGRNAY
jgi:lipopolysaccharide/colanic/teichoic acid biosynthesis glycosyltransferase